MAVAAREEQSEEWVKSSDTKVATIHGGMDVEARKNAQRQFRTRRAKVMVATDAAGEGINLQFCRYLINWDIPWNPNRLEQRMGRIHRYGQKMTGRRSARRRLTSRQFPSSKQRRLNNAYKTCSS